MKTRLIPDEGNGEWLAFRCEGCGTVHSVPVTEGDPQSWSWNRHQEAPVLSPSLLVRQTHPKGMRVCHSFVGCNGAQPGEIIFLPDSTHHLAGQVRPLPEWRYDEPAPGGQES